MVVINELKGKLTLQILTSKHHWTCNSPHSAAIGALYGHIILHVLPASVHRIAVSAVKGTNNWNLFVLGSIWSLNPSVTGGLKEKVTA